MLVANSKAAIDVRRRHTATPATADLTPERLPALAVRHGRVQGVARHDRRPSSSRLLRRRECLSCARCQLAGGDPVVRTAVLIVFVRACGDCVCACVYAVSFWLARWLVTL